MANVPVPVLSFRRTPFDKIFSINVKYCCSSAMFPRFGSFLFETGDVCEMGVVSEISDVCEVDWEIGEVCGYQRAVIIFCIVVRIEQNGEDGTTESSYFSVSSVVVVVVEVVVVDEVVDCLSSSIWLNVF